MIIPFASQAKSSTPVQPMPSQTDLLMALATMHKQGKFNPPAQKADD